MLSKSVHCKFVLYYNSSGKCVAIGINGMFHSVQSKSEAMDILNREIDNQEKLESADGSEELCRTTD
jgi:hypothetical protein